jgi:hypothetical protein
MHKLPGHVLRHLDSYRNAATITRNVIVNDFTAFATLWNSLDDDGKAKTAAALATLYGESIADASFLVVGGDREKSTERRVTDHLDHYLFKLAVAVPE